MPPFARIYGVAAALLLASWGSTASAQDVEPANDTCPNAPVLALNPGGTTVVNGTLGVPPAPALSDVDHFRVRLVPGLRLKVNNPMRLTIRTRDASTCALEFLPSLVDLDREIAPGQFENTFVQRDLLIVIGDPSDFRLDGRPLRPPTTRPSYSFTLEQRSASRVVDYDFPPSIAPNEVAFGTIVMRNVGADTWKQGYRLVVRNTQLPRALRFDPVAVPANVEVGTNGVQPFFFAVTAPKTPDVYRLSAGMANPNGVPFGFLSNTSIDVKGMVPDVGDSEFVSQVIPQTLPRDREMTLRVTMKNTDFLPWKNDEGYALVNLSPGDDERFGFTRAPVPVGRIVGKDETQTFELKIRTPREPGFYLFQTRMAKGDRFFGAASEVAAIVVP